MLCAFFMLAARLAIRLSIVLLSIVSSDELLTILGIIPFLSVCINDEVLILRGNIVLWPSIIVLWPSIIVLWPSIIVKLLHDPPVTLWEPPVRMASLAASFE